MVFKLDVEFFFMSYFGCLLIGIMRCAIKEGLPRAILKICFDDQQSLQWTVEVLNFSIGNGEDNIHCDWKTGKHL